jgi:putative hemolysin
LEQFKATNIHYGIIIDEYGQTQGIITMHDVVEGLVGGVYKLNKNGLKIEKREDGSWLIDGHFPFHEFLHFFELDSLFNQQQYKTLSGLIFDCLKHIPQTGEKLHWHNLEIEIVDMDGVKIDKVIVKLLEPDLSEK